MHKSPLLLGLTATLCVSALLSAASTEAATPKPSSTTLAPGVTLTRSVFHMRSGKTNLAEQVLTVTINLSSHNRLLATSPQNVIGSDRATVLAMAKQENAIAGLNGDVFYFPDPTSVPRGGISYKGHILKSALVGKKAAFYITRNNVAAIGDPGFAGTVATPDGRYGFKIHSQNSLENAKNGALSFVDRNVLSASLPKCAVATISATAGGQFRVRSFDNSVSHFTRVAVGTRALVSCGGVARTWMKQHLVAGRTVKVSTGYAHKDIQTLLSGGRMIIADGKRYNDKDGLRDAGDNHKSDSFVCVMKGGRQVKIGNVEGGHAGMDGMTYAELASWLLGRGCYSALTLDGSNSSQLVAKAPHGKLALVNHQTNPGGPRQLVDGLFVVRS